jgi:hypothetical protein
LLLFEVCVHAAHSNQPKPRHSNDSTVNLR